MTRTEPKGSGFSPCCLGSSPSPHRNKKSLTLSAAPCRPQEDCQTRLLPFDWVSPGGSPVSRRAASANNPNARTPIPCTRNRSYPYPSSVFRPTPAGAPLDRRFRPLRSLTPAQVRPTLPPARSDPGRGGGAQPSGQVRSAPSRFLPGRFQRGGSIDPSPPLQLPRPNRAVRSFKFPAVNPVADSGAEPRSPAGIHVPRLNDDLLS
jgi:hypothetical protein